MAVSTITSATQYLTFKLDEEIFATDISQVREVLDFTVITKVPKTPDFMVGVINLRGSVVPVLDMRLKFGMTKADRTLNTCIIIVEINLEDDRVIIGALADSVQEVIELEPGRIEPPPRIGVGLKTEFIKGMGRHNDRFVIILDIDNICSMDELSLAGTRFMAERCMEKMQCPDVQKMTASDENNK